MIKEPIICKLGGAFLDAPPIDYKAMENDLRELQQKSEFNPERGCTITGNELWNNIQKKGLNDEK